MKEQITTYRVEVSGWDLNEKFFVERTTLRWAEGEEMKVQIRKRVRMGALVFIRLMENPVSSGNFPVAYRARQARERENGGIYDLTLSQVWPAPESSCPGGTVMLDAARERAVRLN